MGKKWRVIELKPPWNVWIFTLHCLKYVCQPFVGRGHFRHGLHIDRHRFLEHHLLDSQSSVRFTMKTEKWKGPETGLLFLAPWFGNIS